MSAIGDRWWAEDPREIYWLEITDRADLGVDLAAPQTNEDGRRYWSYDLVLEVDEGDVVLHYETRPTNGITHWSRATGEPYDDEIIWGAHGQASGRGPVEPYPRPAWRRSLEGPFPLAAPVSMEVLREAEEEIRRVERELRDRYGARTRLYFPFQLSDHRPVRAFQGYITKMPRDLLLAIPGLAEVVEIAEATRPTASQTAPRARSAGIGAAYRRPNEEVATRPERDPHAVDPNLVDRALRIHARVQNAVADLVEGAGLVPRSPEPGEPSFDLAWEDGDTLHLVEVKSMRNTNEEKQLRLALGQIIRYGHQMRPDGLRLVRHIVVESQPSDPSWERLCDALGIRLSWPGRWRLLEEQ